MKKIKKIIGILMFIVIVIATTQVEASSFKLITSANKTTIAPGEETILTFKVSAVDMGNNGIKTLSGYLEYDQKKFEEVTSINGVGATPWSWQYNKETGKFTGIMIAEGVKTTTAIGTITLKARTDATEGKTTIKVKDIKSSDGLTDIASSDSSLDITIKKTTQTPEPPIDQPTNNNQDPKQNNNAANTEYPYAGKSKTLGIIVATIVVLGIVGHKMYSRYQGI